MHEITQQEVIQAVVNSGLDFTVNFAEIDPEQPFALQGLDSLDRSNLLFELENCFDVHIEPESIYQGEWSTLTKVVASLNALVQEKN